jgi:hypothetical protein
MKNLATKIFPLVLSGALLLPLLTLSACNSVNTAGPTPKYPLLVGVTLKPYSVPAIAVAGTLQVNASAQYQVSATEFTEKDVTGSVAWDTSSTAVATVSKGVVTGTGNGSATISAAFEGKSGSMTVFVGLTHYIAISPSGPFSLATPSITFVATEHFSDGSTLGVSDLAFWTTSPGGIIDMYPYLSGDATIVATGSTTVTATLDTGEVGSLDVTVGP